MIEIDLPTGGKATYYHRGDWGARPRPTSGRAYPKLVHPEQFRGFVSHHTVAGDGDDDSDGDRDSAEVARYMRRLQRIREADLGREVPYSWVIFEGDTPADAIICEGRGKGYTGAHTAGYNSTRYGIAWAGNTNHDPVTDGMVAGFRWLAAAMLVDGTEAEPTMGHLESYATECPGSNGMRRLDELQPPFGATSADIVATPFDELPVLGNASSGFTYTGQYVRHWQMMINALAQLGGHSGRLYVSGSFDRRTEQATRNFQSWAVITVDGIVGSAESRPAMAKALTDAAVTRAQADLGFEVERPALDVPIGLWQIVSSS